MSKPPTKAQGTPAPAQEPAPVGVDHATKLFVTKAFGKTAVADGDPEIIAIHRFLTEPAQVEVRMGETINLGNFGFRRVDVGIVVPVYREEIPDAYKFARKYVTDRLDEEVALIRAQQKTVDPF